MTIKKLLETYIFHDSSLNTIAKEKNDSLVLEIELCEFEDESNPKNNQYMDTIKLTFKDIEIPYDYKKFGGMDILDDNAIKKDDVIVGVELGGRLSDNYTYDSLKLYTNSVEVDVVKKADGFWSQNKIQTEN